MSKSDSDKDKNEGEIKEAPLPSHSSVEGGKTSLSGFPFWGKVLVMTVIVFLGAIGYLRSHHQHAENTVDVQEGPSDVPEVSKRKPLPDLVLTTSAGTKKKLSEYNGKVVLLSFWATWCTPCLIELPTFIDLHEKLHAKGLEIVPVNVDEADKATTFVGDFWKTKKFPFPTFFDPTKKATDALKIDSLPSNFVIDKRGRLVAQGYGANDWSADTAVKFIEQLLSE